MALFPKNEFVTDSSTGRIIEVKSGAASIKVKWNSEDPNIIHYVNFIISEVCNNRGIENPKAG